MPEPPPDLLPGAPHDALEGFVEDSLTQGAPIQGAADLGRRGRDRPRGPPDQEGPRHRRRGSRSAGSCSSSRVAVLARSTSCRSPARRGHRVLRPQGSVRRRGHRAGLPPRVRRQRPRRGLATRVRRVELARRRRSAPSTLGFLVGGVLGLIAGYFGRQIRHGRHRRVQRHAGGAGARAGPRARRLPAGFDQGRLGRAVAASSTIRR